MAGLRLDPGVLPEPYGNEQLQRGNQKGFRNVLGGVRRVQQDQPMIEDGCEISRNGDEQEFGSCCQYQKGSQSTLAGDFLGQPCRH